MPQKKYGHHSSGPIAIIKKKKENDLIAIFFLRFYDHAILVFQFQTCDFNPRVLVLIGIPIKIAQLELGSIAQSSY